LDKLHSRWQWLHAQGSYTIFQGYELNRRAAEWFAGRESPYVIVAESEAGMAIIPAARRERELGLIGETLFDYRDVLSAGDGQVLTEAWRALAKLGLGLEVTALRGDEVRQRWESLAPTPFCNAPITRRCDISAEEFVTAHRKAAKASRRLAREGLRLIRHQDKPERLAEWIYRRKSEWSGTSENLFGDRQRQDFMQWIVCNHIIDWSIWSYQTNYGDIAAALMTLEDGLCRHFYTIHHDARWERFSPGQVMIFDVTRESLAEGKDVDFMTGEYPYKNRLATAMVPLYRVSASVEQMASWHDRSQRLTPAA
jgi:CelD/BcsL family acetyltransferase involved in cellulose biosynthesis